MILPDADRRCDKSHDQKTDGEPQKSLRAA